MFGATRGKPGRQRSLLAVALAVGLGLSLSPSAAVAVHSTSTPWTEVEFNRPTEQNNLGIRGQEDGLVSYAQPGSLIQLTMYKLSDHYLANVLVQAAERGVHVEVLLDGRDVSGCKAQGCTESAFAILSQLNELNHSDPQTWLITCNGVSPRRTTPIPGAGNGCIGQRLNHNKFMLASNSYYGAGHWNIVDSVIVSSMNNTKQSYDGGFNNGLLLANEPLLYATYRRYFEEMAGSATTNASPTTTQRFTPTQGTQRVTRSILPHDIESWEFPRAPDDDPVAGVLGRIRTAHDCRNHTGSMPGPERTRIDVAMFAVSGRIHVLRHLAKLRSSGCRVNLVYTNMSGADRRYLVQRGVALHQLCAPVDRAEGKAHIYVHSKYFLVAGGERTVGRNVRVVYTGSENWTDSSLIDADNQMIQYAEPAGHAPVFHAYKTNYDGLLALADRSPPTRGNCPALD